MKVVPDIVDVKNLQEALVGSAEPGLVRDIRASVPLPHHASVPWAWYRTRLEQSPWQHMQLEP